MRRSIYPISGGAHHCIHFSPWQPQAEIRFDASISGRFCDFLNGVLNAALGWSRLQLVEKTGGMYRCHNFWLMQRYNEDLGISRHISTFARQSDQDDRLLGCPLGASPKLPTGDATTMTTMALVPAQQVALRCHAMRWRSGRRHHSVGWPPGDKNWRYGPGMWLSGSWQSWPLRLEVRQHYVAQGEHHVAYLSHYATTHADVVRLGYLGLKVYRPFAVFECVTGAVPKTCSLWFGWYSQWVQK